MNNVIDEKIAGMQREILQINGLIAFLAGFKKDPPEGVRLFPLTSRIVVEVSSMEGLHKARGWLRDNCYYMDKNWEDMRGSTWYNLGTITTEYQGKHHPITIWLTTKPEDFPLELQSDKCRVIKMEPKVEERWAYVCKKDEQPNAG